MRRYRLGTKPEVHKLNISKADEVFTRILGVQWPYCRHVGQVCSGIAVVPLAVLSSKSTYPNNVFFEQ